MGCNCGNKNPQTTIPATAARVTEPITQVVSCNKCHKSPCACLEEHTVEIKRDTYSTVICATNNWVMPEVDECVQLHFNEVNNLLPGAILWNPNVKALHVVSYDSDTGYALARNLGEDDNSPAGTVFPSNICFHVGVPTECNCDSDYAGPCLKADFVSPSSGESNTMSVTTVSGLEVGDVIDVTGYMYRIMSIQDMNTITVKNEGFGATVGTVIEHDPDCTGKACVHKISVVSIDNPCGKEPVDEGSLLVCHDGERRKLEGTITGEVPAWNADKQTFELVRANIREACTVLTSCLTLDPNVTTYLLNVEKTSIFEVGKTFNLGDAHYTVTQILNGTQLRASREAPTAISVIDVGSSVCVDEDNYCNLPNWCATIANNKNTLDTTVRNPTWRPLSLPKLAGILNTVSKVSSSKELAAPISKSKSSNSYTSPTLTISDFVPSDPTLNASRLIIMGYAIVRYKGTVWCDTHHHTPSGLTYPYLAKITNSTFWFTNSLIINGSTQYSYTANKSYEFGYQNAATHIAQNTNISYGNVSEEFLIPISTIVNMSDISSWRLSVKGEIELRNPLETGDTIISGGGSDSFNKANRKNGMTEIGSSWSSSAKGPTIQIDYALQWSLI